MYLGIDIGGTKIISLIIDEKNNILCRSKKKIKDKDPESVLQRAWRCTQSAMEQTGISLKSIKAMGIAVPSSVNNGVALFAPALGWRQTPVVEMAQKLLAQPIYLGNDVNLGLAAEYLAGAAINRTLIGGFFIGTGVGGALIHEGKIIRGKDGSGGELGHMIVMPNGRQCGCGNYGCLEAYASKTAFLAAIKSSICLGKRTSIMQTEIQSDTPMITSRQLLAAYSANDPLVMEILHQGFSLLGVAIATIINTLSPDCIVLGGGVIEAFGADLVKKIIHWTEPYIFGEKSRCQVIRQSSLGDDAVPLGAALLAKANGSLL